MAFGFRGSSRWLKIHPTLGGGDGRTNGYAVVEGPNRPLTIIFSDGMGWDHVSVSTPNRCPNWNEMCFVKSLFWANDDAVMQLHPPQSDYVNIHEYCLHLWRPQEATIPLPPSIMVGPR